MREDGRFGCDHCDRSFTKMQGLISHNWDAHQIRMNVTATRAEGKNFRPSAAQIQPKCIECGKMAHLVKGDVIYPHRRDLWEKRCYLCECGAYVGCHPGSFVPLGYPCGAETRKARMSAHNAFDPLWKGTHAPMNRHQAYKWLAEELAIPRDQCHIGMMTGDQAREVFKIVCDYRQANKERSVA